MKTPNLPGNELTRLACLQSLKILDTEFEERFDRITRLAKKLFNTEIALVSLVDENRQWFKSCLGLPVRETPRDISFCGHAILEEKILYIPDATKDVRFADNPLVTDEPKIRFYAGRPISSPSGEAIGTLCIIDPKPKTLAKEDFNTLNDLANLVEDEIFSTLDATTDELTSLTNRKGLMQIAEQQLKFCKRHAIPLVLVYFDIDKFKEINDEHGHCAGDQALSIFAENLLLTFRESDIVSRIGGDEFVAILSKVSVEEVSEIVERLKESINKTHKLDFDLQFSSGVVELDNNRHFDLNDLIHSADKLMYMNKESSVL